MTHAPVPELPADAPKKGDVFVHYKGQQYRVVGLALDANDEWLVVYEAMYEQPAAELFARRLSEWSEEVEWHGARVPRFFAAT